MVVVRAEFENGLVETASPQQAEAALCWLLAFFHISERNADEEPRFCTPFSILIFNLIYTRRRNEKTNRIESLFYCGLNDVDD